MTLHMEVGLDLGHIVLDGTMLPPKRGEGTTTQRFWPMYCDQMAAWMKMPVGTGVGIGSGHIVLHGEPVTPLKRGTAAPNFGRCLLWPNGWMDQDASKYGDIVSDGDPAPPKKGKSTATFRPISTVAKRLDGSRCHLVWR